MNTYAILTPNRKSIQRLERHEQMPPSKPGRVLPVVPDDPLLETPGVNVRVPGELVIESDRVRQTWRLVGLSQQEKIDRAVGIFRQEFSEIGTVEELIYELAKTLNAAQRESPIWSSVISAGDKFSANRP